MDPELYVFPRINSVSSKIAASTALFGGVCAAAILLIPLLPGPQLWSSVDRTIQLGSAQLSVSSLLHLLLGYGLFIYASYHAWRATRLKNTVERTDVELASRVLDSGYYARVRHPMYAMFILANAGLGFALKSVYGLGFALLSLALFVANGIFEERAVMLRYLPAEYRAYMGRVKARYFTPVQAVVLALILAAYIAGCLF